ncbi:hypothetical protein STEG23_027187, partial [Scotinomys teguina]
VDMLLLRDVLGEVINSLLKHEGGSRLFQVGNYNEPAQWCKSNGELLDHVEIL